MAFRLLCALFLLESVSSSAALRGPFPPAPAPAAGAAVRAACEPAPSPVRDVQGVKYYTDSRHSVVDPALRKANETAFLPIRGFVEHVSRDADRFQATGDAASARCAAVWLSAWARAGALLGAVNDQGGYERKWTLSALALAFLKIRAAAATDAKEVPEWFRKLAAAVRPVYEKLKKGSARNNHAYWAGLAVAAAGVAADDRALLDWGFERYRLAIGQILPDGTLPLEMGRGGRALHYHAFALAPLVLLGELGAANGVALYPERSEALRLLVRKVIRGARNPVEFEKAAGAKQEPLGGDDFAWAEPYLARFKEPELETLVTRLRPLVDRRLGGDLTAAFRHP